MESTLLVVNKLSRAIVLVLSLAIGFACGSGGTNGGGANGGTQLGGSWTITASDTAYPDSVFHVSLVSGPCTVSTPVGVYGENAAHCFIADNAGHGSLTGTGWFFYPPTEVLVESYSNHAAPAQQVAFGLVLIEGDVSSGNFAVFTGTGTFSGDGKMTGTWTCGSGDCWVPNPSGGESWLGGTFTGN